MKRLRLGLLVAGCLALAVVLTGCGSSDESESSDASAQRAWADGACSALTKWKTTVEAAGATLKDFDQLSKAKIEETAASVTAATDTLVGDVKSLGEPPDTGGSEAKAAVNGLANELEASADQIRDATSNITTAADAIAAVNVAGGALLAMSSDIDATRKTLQSLDAADTWKAAFADSEACQSLQKS